MDNIEASIKNGNIASYSYDSKNGSENKNISLEFQNPSYWKLEPQYKIEDLEAEFQL